MFIYLKLFRFGQGIYFNKIDMDLEIARLEGKTLVRRTLVEVYFYDYILLIMTRNGFVCGVTSNGPC